MITMRGCNAGPVLDSGLMEKGTELYDAVRQHYLFSAFDDEVFDGLVARMLARRLAQGEVLFHRADPADAFYFVCEGQIALCVISPTGERKIIEVAQAGTTFAEAVAFMREVRYPVTAEALADTVLIQVPNKPYRDALYSDPDSCMRLLSDVCRRLHARVREIETLTIQNARDRLASYLLDHVVESTDDEATVRLELPRHVIASRLSMKPETLSRLLRGLVDEGVLVVEDRVIYVRSLARLRPYD